MRGIQDMNNFNMVSFDCQRATRQVLTFRLVHATFHSRMDLSCARRCEHHRGDLSLRQEVFSAATGFMGTKQLVLEAWYGATATEVFLLLRSWRRQRSFNSKSSKNSLHLLIRIVLQITAPSSLILPDIGYCNFHTSDSSVGMRMHIIIRQF